MFDCVLTHIFAPKPFGLFTKQDVNGAAMLVGRVPVY